MATVIDDFSSTGPGWPLTTTTIGVLHNEESALSGVIGRVRDTRIDVTGVHGQISEDFVVANGVYAHTLTTTGRASAEFSYGCYRNGLSAPWSVFIDSSRDLNADLTGDLGVMLRFDTIDQPGDVAITIFSDGVEYSAPSFRVTAPGSLEIPFSSFASLTDRGSIDGFHVKLIGPRAWDLSLDSIGTYVPEPTTMAILALGGLGLISRRRKARPV